MKANKNLQQELPLRGYLLAALTAIELLMSFSFLGYFHVEPISITIAFIPVLLAGCTAEEQPSQATNSPSESSSAHILTPVSHVSARIAAGISTGV